MTTQRKLLNRERPRTTLCFVVFFFIAVPDFFHRYVHTYRQISSVTPEACGRTTTDKNPPPQSGVQWPRFRDDYIRRSNCRPMRNR